MANADWFKVHPSWSGDIMTDSVGKSNTEKLAEAKAKRNDTEHKLSLLSEKAVKMNEKYMGQLKDIDKAIIELEDLLEQGFDKELSETCKARCRQQWIEHTTGRTKEIHTKYFDKGILMEDKAIMMLSKLDSEFYDKNLETFYHHPYIEGTPDIIHHEKVIDVKCSWDIFNFFKVKFTKLDKGYMYQLQCYMELLKQRYPKLEDSELCYCLMNTPVHLKAKAIKDIEWRTGEFVALSEKEYAQLEKNHTFDDMPDEKKVIRFSIKRDDAVIEAIEKRVIECRKYIETLS
jgi:hypothetical protein